MNPQQPSDDSAALRRRAESAFGEASAREPDASTALSRDAARELLHELRVHQIELEMQNDELRRSQLELQASQARWFELYELAPVGYCSVSEGGLILNANLAAASLFGLPRSALGRRRLSEFIAPEHQDSFYKLRRRLLQTANPQSCELQLLQARGAGPWVLLTASIATDEVQGQTLRAVFTDITAQKHLDNARQSQRVAEQASRAKSAFLSRMSHEFRTPLNAILGFSDLLLMPEQPPLDSRQRQQVLHIHDAGAHMLQLVSDLLDVARIETGVLRLEMAPVDLLQVLRAALEQVEQIAAARHVQLDLLSPAVDQALVSADPTRLLQVLLNLLSNAIKFNHEGGSASVALARRGSRWRITVCDTGAGISESEQTMLFQPFNRLGHTDSTIEGAGLGLVITRDLVLAMGGDLHVHSKPGVGSVFQVELHAEDSAPTPPAVPPAAP